MRYLLELHPSLLALPQGNPDQEPIALLHTQDCRKVHVCLDARSGICRRSTV